MSNVNAGVGAGMGTIDLERQLRLGEESRLCYKAIEQP